MADDAENHEFRYSLYVMSVTLNSRYHVRPRLPSSWVLGDPSSLSSAGCVFHPKSSTSESRSPSTDDTFHSVTQDTPPSHHFPDKDARHRDVRDGVLRSEGRSPGAAAAP